jgi:hypothetical protein
VSYLHFSLSDLSGLSGFYGFSGLSGDIIHSVNGSECYALEMIPRQARDGSEHGALESGLSSLSRLSSFSGLFGLSGFSRKKHRIREKG